jgi:hypothetical protein
MKILGVFHSNGALLLAPPRHPALSVNWRPRRGDGRLVPKSSYQRLQRPDLQALRACAG